MNLKFYILAILLAVLVGFSGNAIFERTSQAQRETPQPKTRERWEFCAITKTGSGTQRGSYVVRYFSAHLRTETIDENATDSGALARKIADLGRDSWELIAAGPFEFKTNAGAEALYFKRRLPFP